METFHVDICGQSVSLNLDSHLYDPANRSILGPYDYFERGTESDLELSLIFGKSRRVYADDDYYQLKHYRGKAGSHIIRQMACHLAAYHRRSFSLVHGTGLSVGSKENKGLLIIGKGGSGKSTLSQGLQEIIMDDDLMVVTRDKISVTGRMGFVTYKHPVHGRKFLSPLPNGVKESELALVIILEKKVRGGTFWEMDNSIPREYSVPEDMPPAIKRAYMHLPPIRVEAPIFRIGTQGNVSGTLDILRYVIEKHI